MIDSAPQIGIGTTLPSTNGQSSQSFATNTRNGPATGATVGIGSTSTSPSTSLPISVPKSLSHFTNPSTSTAGVAMNDGANVNGQQFLSLAGIDTQSLFRRARDLQNKANTGTASGAGAKNTRRGAEGAQDQSESKSQPMLNPNLHQSIAQQRASTIHKILLKQRYKTHQIAQEKKQERLRAIFQQTMDCLGEVVQGTGRRAPDPSLTGISLSVSGAGSAVAGAGAVHKVDMNSLLIQSHLKLQSKLGTAMESSASPSSNYDSSHNTLDKLSQIAHENNDMAYLNAVELMLTICDPIHGQGGGGCPNSRGRTLAVLSFLCQQFRNFILAKVKNSHQTERGSDILVNLGAGGLIGYIHKYVEMEVGSTVMNQGRVDIMWRFVYYALRCGDLQTVREVLQKGTQVDEVLIRYMDEALRIGNGIRALGEVNDLLVKEVGELYRRVESRSRNQNRGDGREYELAVLGLLSFSPMDASSVQRTTEDYIFMELWNSIRSDDCIEIVCALADNVKHYGAAHFDDDLERSDGWVYAMLLLLCQQIKSGLGYLAGKSAEGMCIAVHLGLALAEEGIALTDLKKDEVTAAGAGSTLDDDLAALVTAYARSLQTVSPTSALDYLVHIPGSAKAGIEFRNGDRLTNNALNQICRLVLDTKAFAVLGGRMAPDGSRVASGALDKHFGKRAVSEILSTVAQQSMREGRVADAAELLSLAGRYSDLLSILNRQLAGLLVTENLNERSFWRDAAINFHGTYLAQGQTHVLKVLEAERNLSLGNAFQMLLNLMAFFDRCNEGKWESAWDIIDNLNVFPISNDDVLAKVETFNSLSSCIQDIFHNVISQAMQSLYEQHSQLKSSLGLIHQGPNSGVRAIEQRLYEIRNRARNMVTFASLISLNCGVELKAKIGRLEAYMV